MGNRPHQPNHTPMAALKTAPPVPPEAPAGPPRETRAVSAEDLEQSRQAERDQALAQAQWDDDGGPARETRTHTPPTGPGGSAANSDGAAGADAYDAAGAGPLDLSALPEAIRGQLQLVVDGLADKMAMKRISVSAARTVLADELGRLLADLDLSEETGPDPDEMIEGWTIVDGEYVKKDMPRWQVEAMLEPQDRLSFDHFAIGDAYRSGDQAAFDHYWASDIGDQMKRARAAGWLPVKQSLDQVHDDSEGYVKDGDAILCYRPKAMAAKYEAERRAVQDSMMGSLRGDMDDMIGALPGGKNHVSTIVDGKHGLDVDEVESLKRKARAGAPSVEEVRDRAKTAAKKSVTFEKNPLYDNKKRAALSQLVR